MATGKLSFQGHVNLNLLQIFRTVTATVGHMHMFVTEGYIWGWEFPQGIFEIPKKKIFKGGGVIMIDWTTLKY